MTYSFNADLPCLSPSDMTAYLVGKIAMCNETTVRMVTNVGKYEVTNQVTYNHGISSININLTHIFTEILLVTMLIVFK